MKASEIDGCECWLNAVRGVLARDFGSQPQRKSFGLLLGDPELLSLAPSIGFGAFEVARCGSNLCFNLSLKTMHSSS